VSVLFSDNIMINIFKTAYFVVTTVYGVGEDVSMEDEIHFNFYLLFLLYSSVFRCTIGKERNLQSNLRG
jgi:hypothetical protein